MAMGLLKWRRMPYGKKTSIAIFQRAIEQVLGEDIKNIFCYPDDICIGATNENELKMKTDIVLNIFRNAGMTMNKKFVNNCCKISFGNSISKEVISPTKDLMENYQK